MGITGAPQKDGDNKYELQNLLNESSSDEHDDNESNEDEDDDDPEKGGEATQFDGDLINLEDEMENYGGTEMI